MPALLTAMSILSNAEIVFWIAEPMEVSEEVSVSSSRIERSLWEAWRAEEVAFREAGLMSQSARRRTPWAAKAWAVDWPMPVCAM